MNITPQQAEDLAKKAVQDYLNACQLQNPAQVGDVLMKLCSVAGVVMAQAEGSQMAHDRLVSTGIFILNSMPPEAWQLRPMQ